jgi:hypothetical protein
VEEQQHPDTLPQVGEVTIKIFIQEDDTKLELWMQAIHVQCSKDGKTIGRGFGRFVRRGWIRSNFWRDMEEPC